jgi:hypothetical protein
MRGRERGARAGQLRKVGRKGSGGPFWKIKSFALSFAKEQQQMSNFEQPKNHF